jgi:hypothetical protein
MLISIGEKDTILHEGYLHSTPCNNCNHEEQNYVTIWAKSFVFGPWFLPIKWATWGKQAVVTCNNCKKATDISETTGYLRRKMETLTKEFPLWKKNILGIIIGGYYAISFISSLIFGIIGAFIPENSTANNEVNSSTEALTISPDSLKGSWLAPTILVDNKHESEMSSLDKKVVDITMGEFEFEVFQFLPNGNFVGVKDGLFQESKWSLANNVVQLFDGNNIKSDRLKFTQPIREGIELQTTKLFNDKPVNFNFQMYRFKLGKNEGIFYNYAQKIFKNIAKAKNDEEIKEKVKNSLNYYSIYFQAISDSKLNGFKPLAVLLPMRFYSGGIGLTEFSEQQHWKRIYYDDKDAKKAYKYLEEALSKVSTYPKRENLILEYSAVFKEMAEKL